MKNTTHLFCFALSFAFYNSFAQPTELDNKMIRENGSTPNFALIDNLSDLSKQGEATEYYRPSSIKNADKSRTTVDAEVTVYPEPFKGVVAVDLTECPDAKICLYYESGKCIKYQDCENETKALFNLRNEPKGLYFMEIVSNGKKIVKKLDME